MLVSEPVRLMTTVDLKRQEFEAFMARHTAQLADVSKRYIGRMSPEDKNSFLSYALERAWAQYDELMAFNQETDSVQLLRWWEDSCLKSAALSRPSWTLRTWDRQRETVPGRRLGRSAFV